MKDRVSRDHDKIPAEIWWVPNSEKEVIIDLEKLKFRDNNNKKNDRLVNIMTNLNVGSLDLAGKGSKRQTLRYMA